MKKDGLNLTLFIIVILVFAASLFYYYKGLKSDLNTIIEGKNLNVQVSETNYNIIKTPTPIPELIHTASATEEVKELITGTPIIDSAYYTEITPDPQALQSVENTKKTIIYNTHPFERLESGLEITEYSKKLSNKLNDLGTMCIFLNNNNRLISDSYEKSRTLVKDNIKDYSKNILFDIHASDDIHMTNKEVSIWVGKGNINFEENKKFADSFLKEINSIEPSMECEVLLRDKYIWNQDLSEKAVLMIIGSKDASEERINQIIDVLATAVRNMQG